MHSPPHYTRLDVLYNGHHVGSKSIRTFIEQKKPFLTLHGHIHEASDVSGTFWDKMGDTISINTGQTSKSLMAVTFDLEHIDSTLKHTTLGLIYSGKK